MPIATRLNALTCAFLAMIVCPPVSAATVLDCDTPNISVEADSGKDADFACKATAIAIPRLAALGLTLQEPVQIKVTEILEHVPGAYVAFYCTADREIQVLTTECLEDPPARATAFSEMEAAVLFESLIVHELTHAAIDQWLPHHFVPKIVHEYLAYAIQLDTLPTAERQRILAKANVRGPPDIARINEALLDIAPLYFAAASWLFFTANGGDANHVKSVLDGGFLFDSLME